MNGWTNLADELQGYVVICHFSDKKRRRLKMSRNSPGRLVKKDEATERPTFDGPVANLQSFLKATEFIYLFIRGLK